jgi:hypothetical protein
MPSKTIQTPAGSMIVDDSFDESSIDPFSMIDPEEKKLYEEKAAELEEDTLTINGETFTGKIKSYSIVENRKTKRKTVKIVLVA